MRPILESVKRTGRNNIKNRTRLTHLSSMPWLRLSFMLTITSRGCIFLSPLHFGVVTLPRECTSDTNDYYVRPHMYTLPEDDVVTPTVMMRSTSISFSLSASLLTRFNSRRESSVRSNDVHTYTNKLGVQSVTYRCSLRRSLTALSRCSTLFYIPRRFSEFSRRF